MTDFLRVFEAKALAAELTAAGHAVSERTVQRWKAGKTQPKPQDIKAIRDLVGATLPDTQKSAPPADADEAQMTADISKRLDQIMTRDEVQELVRTVKAEVMTAVSVNHKILNEATEALHLLGGLSDLLREYRTALEEAQRQLDAESQADSETKDQETPERREQLADRTVGR